MMKLTKREQNARLNPHQARGNWFYLNEGPLIRACSFHRDGQDGVYITAAVLMRALQRTGLLRQWDQKQQVFRHKKKKSPLLKSTKAKMFGMITGLEEEVALLILQKNFTAAMRAKRCKKLLFFTRKNL